MKTWYGNLNSIKIQEKIEKDISLIQRCIDEKWDLIVIGYLPKLSYNSVCPLCEEYINMKSICCEHCPIKLKTNFAICKGTVIKNLEILNEKNESDTDEFFNNLIDMKAFLEETIDELKEMLKSVHPNLV